MEEVLRAHLLADAGLQGVVAARIDWGLRPPQLPSIRLTLVSAVPFYTYAGIDGLKPHRVQADCFATTYAAAKITARALRAALAAIADDAFDSIFEIAERDGDDKDAAGQPVHVTSLDFRIWHHTT